MTRLWIAAAALAACGNNNNGGPADASGKHDAAIDAAVHHDAAPDAPPAGLTSFPLASIDEGIAYTATIAIGGTQTFALDVDTGSTTLGVAGSTCSACGVAPEYMPGAGAVDQHSTASSTYGDGTSWTGENYSDTVGVMGDTAVTMRFSSITTQDGFFRPGFPNEGIIGFATPDLALAGTDGYVAKRQAAGLASEFAFQFCPDDGTVWFGGYDATHTAAAPQFTPMTVEGFYVLSVTSSTIGTADLTLSGTAIADTGTSLMIVSQAVETALLNAVSTSSGYTSIFGTQTLDENNCIDPGTATRADIDAALPPMTVTLPSTAGGTFTVSMAPTQSYLFEQQGEYCLGVAAVGDLPTILGDAFLRQFVTIFDAANSRFGLAPEAGCVLPAPPRVKGPKTPPHWFVRGR